MLITTVNFGIPLYFRSFISFSPYLDLLTNIIIFIFKLYLSVLQSHLPRYPPRSINSDWFVLGGRDFKLDDRNYHTQTSTYAETNTRA
jgi:hypothetical protein